MAKKNDAIPTWEQIYADIDNIIAVGTTNERKARIIRLKWPEDDDTDKTPDQPISRRAGGLRG